MARRGLPGPPAAWQSQFRGGRLMVASAATAAGSSAATAASPAVEMRHIDKRFGAVQANRDVHLSVAAGSVHAPTVGKHSS